MGRFRIQLGGAEVEYEGEDSQERFDVVLDWIRTKATSEAEARADEVQPPEIAERVEKRGGQRSAVIGPAVDKLVDDRWLAEHHSVPDIVRELKSRGIPGVRNENVNLACMRRVRVGKLDTVLEGGQRIFWTKSTK